MESAEPVNSDNAEFASGNVSPIIVVENGERVANVQIAAVDSLFQDIGAYNKQFSLGGQMSSLISGLFDREEGEEFENPLGKISEEQQHMSASGLNVIHGDLLARVGLSLEPVTGKDNTVFFEGQSAGSGEMRLNISDRGQFAGFLKGLSPDQVSETPLGENLATLTGVLNKQVLDNYSLNEPNDNTLSFLGSLGTIVDEYKRLGLSTEAEKLEEYLVHSREGNLREFVAVKASGLMQEPGKGFGPADWVGDASPSFLSRKWNEAFHILRSIRENPKAHDIYKQLLDQLNMSAAHSREKLSEIEYYTPEHRAALGEILTVASDGLSGFEA